MKLLALLLPCFMFAQIEGTVINKIAFKDKGNIYTKNIIQTNSGTREVVTIGGVLGLEALHVSHTPQLEKGVKGKFYVKDKMLVHFEEEIENILADITVSPTSVKAGVRDMVVISGSGFGEYADNVKVGFSDANFGGYIYHDVLPTQIKSWSDSQILVEVPSRAGTGKVRVQTKDSLKFVSDPITVEYAVINLNYNGYAFRTQHVGEYQWQFNNDTPILAREVFEKSLDTWRCSTGIDWSMGSDTEVNVVADDGVNVVLFSDLGGGTLGQCYSRYEGCAGQDGINWYIKELDIIFNQNKNWNYEGEPAYNEIDFETVCVHELGHGHQLGHKVCPICVMHYSVAAGVKKAQLDDNDLEGARSVQTLSTTRQVCNKPLMENSECTLSTKDFEFDYVNADKTYYNILGQEVEDNYKGIIIIKYEYLNRVEFKKKIK